MGATASAPRVDAQLLLAGDVQQLVDAALHYVAQAHDDRVRHDAQCQLGQYDDYDLHSFQYSL